MVKISISVLAITTALLFSNQCFCNINDPIPENDDGLLSNIGTFFSWLIRPALWIKPDSSDKYDLRLSSQITSKFESPKGSKNAIPNHSNIFSKFTDGLWNVLKYGRYPAAYTNYNIITTLYDTVLQAGQCLTTGEFTDPDLGFFGMNMTKYCNIKCQRFIPGVLCCNPQKPDMIDVKFRHYAPGKQERILNWRDPNDRQHLTPSSRVVYIIHGLFEKVSTSAWMIGVKDAYIEQGNDVIIIDHRRANAIHYWQAIANGRLVGAMIGKSVMNWGIHERTLLVGFSLGGQIVGEAGHYTQVHGNITIDECHGLDPAGPFYDGCDDTIRLDKTDCRIVQAIHTSAQRISSATTPLGALGTWSKVGHCDFWVNCGHKQGPCYDIDFFEFIKGVARLPLLSDGELTYWLAKQVCSHWRAPSVYLSSVRNECKYEAFPCPDCGPAVDCKKTMSKVANNTMIPFSRCTPDKDENYYVKSSSKEPFCDSTWNAQSKQGKPLF